MSRPNYGTGYGNSNYNPYASRSNTSLSNPYASTSRDDLGNSNPYGYSNSNSSNNNIDNDPYTSSQPSYSTYNGAASSEPPPPVAPRRSDRRAGAYGATSYGNSIQSFREPSPPGNRAANRRSIGAGWNNRSPTRRPPGDRAGGASRQIEDILKTIKHDWSSLTDEKCVPILVALQFMDDSSLGLARKYDAFRDVHEELQVALRQIVNEEHQGFNSSIGRFHAIQHALSTSQNKIRSLKESLAGAREHLSADKPELEGLAKTSQNYDDMLMTLADIEDLQNVPDQLEARISEKRFIGAVDVLQRALKKIRKPDMAEIGALSELKVYLSNQEHALTDILTEELHNHLYLKSPYCENRWKQHASQHVRGVNRDKDTNIGERQLYRFLDQLDSESAMTDDATRNPEADSFAYIQLLVESLNSLGRLDSAVESVAQRLPVELFRVVDKTTSEIEQRYPAALRSGLAFNDPLNFKDPARTAVLNDLFGTLFARFEAIAEGHRVVHEVISGITKRDGLRGSSSLTSGFRELWKLYQSEMRSIFHDYLSSNQDMYGRQQNTTAGQNIFSKTPRDKNKKIFKLGDMDSKSTDLATEREDLQNILHHSVPGLVSDSKRGHDISHDTSSGNAIDGSATGHRLLVEPNVFNMAILLPPSLVFISRLKEVVPQSSDVAVSTLTSFLDDFLINVFLPQLEETVTDMSTQIMIQSNAFSADPEWSTAARKPIFKGTARFYTVIEAFCDMLDILPHDPNFSQLIINQLVTYYDKCYGWYKSIVARVVPHPMTGKKWRVAADLTERGELKDITAEIMLPANEVAMKMAIDTEITLLLNTIGRTPLHEADLILDRRSLSNMAMLSTSMKWLADKILALRHVSQQHASTSVDVKRQSDRFERQRRWTLITAQSQSEPDHVYLPLTEDIAPAFDAAQKSFGELAATVTKMLHVEMRAHIFFYLSKVLGRSFNLDRESHEPDPEIAALNTDLIMFDEDLSSHLHPAQRSFITTGLSSLVDSILVSAVMSISSMNALGVGKLLLAILVLQQNLKNVEATGASLNRAAAFYEAFASGPDAIVALAKQVGKSGAYSAEEVKSLLRLVFGEQLGSERRETVVKAEKEMEKALNDVHTAMD